VLPSVVYTGDTYAIAWADAEGDGSTRCQEKGECVHTIYLSHLSSTGGDISPPVKLSTPGKDATDPTLLFTGGGSLLSYQDTAGDSSPECAKDPASCSYGAEVAYLDRDGKILKSTPIPGVMDPKLYQDSTDPYAYLIGWGEGVYLAKVSPGGEVA